MQFFTKIQIYSCMILGLYIRDFKVEKNKHFKL